MSLINIDFKFFQYLKQLEFRLINNNINISNIVPFLLLIIIEFKPLIIPFKELLIRNILNTPLLLF